MTLDIVMPKKGMDISQENIEICRNDKLTEGMTRFYALFNQYSIC